MIRKPKPRFLSFGFWAIIIFLIILFNALLLTCQAVPSSIFDFLSFLDPKKSKVKNDLKLQMMKYFLKARGKYFFLLDKINELIFNFFDFFYGPKKTIENQKYLIFLILQKKQIKKTLPKICYINKQNY